MASPASPSFSGPGIIVSFYKIPASSELSEETFEKWYDEVYIPDSIASAVVKSAFRWKAADPSYGKQQMTIAKVPELAALHSEAFRSVKRTSDTFPNESPIEDFVEFDVRIFSLVEYFETQKQPEDAYPLIIMACMEPGEGGEASLDAWYRDEHNQQMSEQPGWKRTTRFELVHQNKNDGSANDALKYFTIHEFGEGHKIGKEVLPLDPMTEWTKKEMQNAKAIDAAVYRKTKSYGKAAERVEVL